LIVLVFVSVLGRNVRTGFFQSIFGIAERLLAAQQSARTSKARAYPRFMVIPWGAVKKWPGWNAPNGGSPFSGSSNARGVTAVAACYRCGAHGARFACSRESGRAKMIRMRLGRMVAVAAAVTAVFGPVVAHSQDYPNRTVTIVAPAAPGGLYSLFARLVGTRLEQRFGKTFVVENRPGASSVVGATYVARANPDGYTLMVAASSTMATNVTLFKNLPYDPTVDLAPVALIARVPEVLVVNAALPVHSVADIARLAKATPGGLHFGSAGPGTSQHLGGEMLKTALGVELTHVPYKGMQPAISDVAGGHIPMTFSPITIALPLIQAGKLRPIGLSMAQRVEALPDVPPLTEVGVKDFDAASWFMLVAPGKTPKDIIEKLHGELRVIGSDRDTRSEFVRLGLVPVESLPPDELKRFVASEIARWANVVRQAGLAGSE